MINCPRCKANLPDWTKVCQFCHNDLAAVPRPTPVPGANSDVNYGVTPTWIWFAYYAVSIYFIFDGSIGIIQSLQPEKLTKEMIAIGMQPSLGLFNYLGVAFGAIYILIGIGLVLRIEIIRGIVNWICGMRIIFGLFSLLGAILGLAFSGLWGYLIILALVLRIATAGFMIFLIGETDRYCSV